MDLLHIQNTSIPITNAKYKQYCDLHHQTWVNMVTYLLKEYNKKDANIFFLKLETTVMLKVIIDYMNRDSLMFWVLPYFLMSRL